jgi:hypothetical protein
MFSAVRPRFIAVAHPTFRSASLRQFVPLAFEPTRRIAAFSTSRTSSNEKSESPFLQKFPDPASTLGSQRFREFGVGCLLDARKLINISDVICNS